MAEELMMDLEHLVLGLGSCGFQQLPDNMGDHRGSRILGCPRQKRSIGRAPWMPFLNALPASLLSSRPPPTLSPSPLCQHLQVQKSLSVLPAPHLETALILAH